MRRAFGLQPRGVRCIADVEGRRRRHRDAQPAAAVLRELAPRGSRLGRAHLEVLLVVLDDERIEIDKMAKATWHAVFRAGYRHTGTTGDTTQDDMQVFTFHHDAPSTTQN